MNVYLESKGDVSRQRKADTSCDHLEVIIFIILNIIFFVIIINNLIIISKRGKYKLRSP